MVNYVDSGVYGAMPVVESSTLTEPTSAKEVLFNFEGEDRRSFVLVPGDNDDDVIS